jgi:hypothetical protein
MEAGVIFLGEPHIFSEALSFLVGSFIIFCRSDILNAFYKLRISGNIFFSDKRHVEDPEKSKDSHDQNA